MTHLLYCLMSPLPNGIPLAINFSYIFNHLLLMTGFVILISLVLAGFTHVNPDYRHLKSKKTSGAGFLSSDLRKHYQKIFLPVSKSVRRPTSPVIQIVLIIFIVINIGLMGLFPISRQFREIPSNTGLLILLLLILLNMLPFSLIQLSTSTIDISYFRNNRKFFIYLLVIATATVPISIILHTFNIHKILISQQQLVFHLFPAWNSIRSLIISGNSLIYFFYVFLLFQFLTTHERPDQSDFSLLNWWKYSLMVLLLFSYTVLFWGGYIPVSTSGIEFQSNFKAITWLTGKLIVILIFMRILYRSLPLFNEEQLIRLTFTYIFPFQLTTVFLTILIHLN